MTLNECVFWIGTAIIAYDATVACAHVWIYGTRANWRKYEEGKALMGTMLMFALLLSYGTYNSIHYGGIALTGYPGRGLIRIGIYVVLGFAVTRWFCLLLKNLRRAREEVSNGN
jgi:hypothetical protein